MATWTNVLIGGTALTSRLMPLSFSSASTSTLAQNLKIGVLFTVSSVVRSYVIRRWFNKHVARWAKEVIALSSRRVPATNTVARGTVGHLATYRRLRQHLSGC
jgi:hypothetical protein